MLSRQTVAVLVAAAGLALLVVPAQAQLPSLQGVQPIFASSENWWFCIQFYTACSRVFPHTTPPAP